MLHIILLHILCEQNTITCLLIVPAKRYLDRIFLLASVCCFFFTGISNGVSKTVLSFLTVTASVIFVAEISRIWLFIDVNYYIVLRDVVTLI